MRKCFYFLLVAMLCYGFVGCEKEKDENNDEVENTITLVGSWRCIHGSEYYLLYFDETGKGWIDLYDKEESYWLGKVHFHYAYEPLSGYLAFDYLDDELVDEFTVQKLTEKSLTMTDIEGSNIEFVRISDGEVESGGDNFYY